MSTAPVAAAAPSDHVADRVRTILFERDSSLAKLAAHLGVGQHWTTKRLGRSRIVDLTLEDTQAIADALGVPLAELLPPTP